MKVKTVYKFKSRYPNAYQALEDALVNYAHDHDRPELTPIEAAKEVLAFCNSAFNYERNHQQRVVEFLQGLGLGIPFYNWDIIEMAGKDGQLSPNATEGQRQKILDNYWNFMAMRLIHISEGRIELIEEEEEA